MSITIKYVAARAGVSASTVSRVLNDRPGISEETRKRVLQAAQELNFHPSVTARSLATNRTYNIGYISYKYNSDLPVDSRFANAAPGTMEGIDEELSRRGYHLIATWVDKNFLQKFSVPNMVRQKKVDGVILNGPVFSPRYVLELQSTGIPIVLVDNVLNETLVDSVMCDNEHGAYKETRHLIEVHGHEKIVFLSGPKEWPSSRERATGYRKALEEAGLEPHIVYMPSTVVATGKDAMLIAMEKYPDLTAVVCVNDATAAGAIQACQQTGRSIPDDVAVVGFDDEAWASIYTPPLTTVRGFWYEVGIQAAQRVVDLVEKGGGTPPLQIRVGVQLVIRQSCGCSG